MSEFVIEPHPRPAVRVENGGLFPVRRLYCIGRNYADHAIEMGHDPSREEPFFFQKNPDSIDLSGEFPHPPRPATCISSSSWSWRWRAAGATFPRPVRSTTYGAMAWAST